MKRFTLIFSLLFTFGAFSLMAQDDEVKTIFSEIEITRISGFGGPEMSFSYMNGQFAHFTGGGGGVILNNFYFGGYGTSIANTSEYTNNYETQIIRYGHGGLWFGYEFIYRNMIHPVVTIKTGWGSAEVKNGYQHEYENTIFVVTPMVAMEVNITRYFKIRLGAEYQLVAGINQTSDFSNQDFSALGANLSFLFGWF